MESLSRHNNYPVAVVGDKAMPGRVPFVEMDDEDLTNMQRSRWAKVNLGEWSPFDHTCYLDADTRAYADISFGFQVLTDGWEFVIAPNVNQDGKNLMWHIGDDERAATLEELAYVPMALQCGVMYFRKCRAVFDLFKAWREEWLRWKQMDQAAFLRAIDRCQVKLWLLSEVFNGGAVIGHRFGATRE